MLLRYAAERPQVILQANRQSGEALATQHDFGMLAAEEGQPEKLEPLRELLTSDRDPEWPGIGEVG